MAWLSRVNFIASDTLSFSDINNLGNDIRAWGGNVNGGGYVLSNVVLSAFDLSTCFNLPISTGVSGLGTGVATFLGTPSSANLAAAITNETGTGSLVFATSPTIVTPTVTTSAVIPLVNGGTAVSSTLTLQSTSGAGSSDAIIFKTASQSERMRIDTLGRVLVGAVSPSNANSKFSVTTAATAPTQLEILQVGNALALLGNKASDTNFYITNDYDGTGLGVANRSITLTKTGEVGIGMTSPGAKLDVSGTILFRGTGTDPGAYAVLYMNDSVSPYTGFLAGTTLGFNTGGNSARTTRMYIDSAGLVGIGTTSPGAKLDVTGSVRASQSITIGTSGTYQAGSIYSDANWGMIFRATSASPTSAEFRWVNSIDSELMRLESAGNFKLGGTASRATTAGTNQVVIFNGTAPVGTLANGCSFFSTAGEMRVMDAAGNWTQISPHDRKTNEWIYNSVHTPSGRGLKINVEKLLRFVNDHFGLDCVHDLIEEA